MIFFFHKSHRVDIPAINLQSYISFLQSEVKAWQELAVWHPPTEKIKKIYQILVAATLFRQEQAVLSIMASVEDKMDLKLNNLYCSILTYSARGLANEATNKRLWADKAVQICQDVYQKIGDQSAAYNRAAASYALGDLVSAQEWIERALKLNQTIFGYHLLKAEILSAQDITKNSKEIEACYKEALRLNPFQQVIWEELIRLQKKYGSEESANESLKKAVRFFPKLKELKL
jgi:tetratricopeptide (TPR) repeat protein